MSVASLANDLPAAMKPTHKKAGWKAGADSRLLLNGTVDGDRPLLSIAIPTFRRFDLLGETLDSVFALHFDMPVEVLVVDNDPENDAVALAAMQRFQDQTFSYYKNNSNVGMFGNWNRCLQLARGKYITILHDDDLLLPAFAEEINRRLGREQFNGDIVAFECGILDQRENRAASEDSSPLKSTQALISQLRAKVRSKSIGHLFFANPFCGTLSIVLDRQKALDLGGFDPKWFPIADYEFWCRWAVHVGPIPLVKVRAGLYRMRENESMHEKTRKTFVTQSRALREKLIETGCVPSIFRLTLDKASRVQETSINDDWRTADEKAVSRFAVLDVLAWRALAFMLSRVVCLHAPSQQRGRRPS